jgi:hypothetical protein
LDFGTLSPPPAGRLNFGTSTVSLVAQLDFECSSPPLTGCLDFEYTHSAKKNDDGSLAYPEEDDHVYLVPIERLNFESPDEQSPHAEFKSAEKTHQENLHTFYEVNQQTPPPPVPETKKTECDDKSVPMVLELAVPVSEFLSSLCEHGVLSPLPSETLAFSSPSTPPIGAGSYTTAFQSPNNPNSVIKISELGTNGKSRTGDAPKVDNKSLLELLIAFNKCRHDPNCAEVSGINMYQTNDGWRMSVEQEECSRLTCDDAKAVLECFIALLRKFLPTGVYPKDFKISNFGKNVSGKVVWFDFDFGTVNKKKPVPSFVSSGDFQFDGNEQFRRLLLALIELFCSPITSLFNPPLVKDRKDVFRMLNEQKGLLQKHGLLSSEKAISQTTIEDFQEVLRNIGLSEEDNAYLVGLLTPPASSQ